MLMQIIENIRLRFNDWFIGFIIKNEEKIMENEMKKYKKKQKKEEKLSIEIPEKVMYPKLNFINEGVYYKLLQHPCRPNVKVYVSSFDLFPMTVAVTTSTFDTPSQIEDKMKSVMMLLNKIDTYNNLKPVRYYWTMGDGKIELGYEELNSKEKSK